MKRTIKANVKITLNETLEDSSLTRNAVAVEGKIRPATISELCNGKSKAISFDTLVRIVDALNTLSGDKHTINDVIEITYAED